MTYNRRDTRQKSIMVMINTCSKDTQNLLQIAVPIRLNPGSGVIKRLFLYYLRNGREHFPRLTTHIHVLSLPVILQWNVGIRDTLGTVENCP